MYLIVHGAKKLMRISLIIRVSVSLCRLYLCTIVYTSLKNSVASTHAIRVYASPLCTSLYTAKKSYFALSSLSEFLRDCEFCARVLLCTRRLKIPSHLRTLSEFLRVSTFCACVPHCTRRKKVNAY